MSVNKVSSTDGSLSPISGGTLYTDAPVGTLYPLMSATIPENFILCDGTAYSATDYPELWAILPATVKDTTNNTFTIDLREATVKGAGLTGKSSAHYDTDGLSLGEFIDDRVQAHTHNSPGSVVLNGSQWQNGTGVLLSSVNAATTNQTGRTGDTTEVKAVGVNWIIKAKSAALPTDFTQYIRDQNELSDPEPLYGSGATLALTTSNQACPYDGFISMGYNQSHGRHLYVNNVARAASYNEQYGNTLYAVKKGDLLRVDAALSDYLSSARWFKKRDYTGR